MDRCSCWHRISYTTTNGNRVTKKLPLSLFCPYRPVSKMVAGWLLGTHWPPSVEEGYNQHHLGVLPHVFAHQCRDPYMATCAHDLQCTCELPHSFQWKKQICPHEHEDRHKESAFSPEMEPETIVGKEQANPADWGQRSATYSASPNNWTVWSLVGQTRYPNI